MSDLQLFNSLAFLVCRVEYFNPNTKYVRTSFIKACECCPGKMIAAEVGVYEGINAKYMLMDKKDLELLLGG